MANPVYSIKDTGRNSASTADVRNMASNILTSMTSVTTGSLRGITYANSTFVAVGKSGTILTSYIGRASRTETE